MKSIPNILSRLLFFAARRFHYLWEYSLCLFGRFVFTISGVKYGNNLRLHGLPIFSMRPSSNIVIGDNCRFRSSSQGNAIGVNHAVILRTMGEGAILKIGDDFGMSGGAICAVGSVRIGSRVMVGANTIIADSDFHSLDPLVRSEGGNYTEFRPIVIEDDVWIGADVYIGKGVKIGRSSIVGAKSVVTRDVLPNTVVAGNPAKFIKTLPFDAKGAALASWSEEADCVNVRDTIND